MVDLNPRETHLLRGLAAQIVIVALLVFSFTMAARQLRGGAERFHKAKEQLAQAKAQWAKAAQQPELKQIQAELFELESQVKTPDVLPGLMKRLAEEQIGMRDLQVTLSPEPEQTLQKPVANQWPVTIQLYGLEVEGRGTLPQIIKLLAAAASPKAPWIMALDTLRLEAASADPAAPFQFRLKWLAAVKRG